MDIEKVKKEIVKIIEAELPEGYNAFFFGSRITGTAGERSDLDVGLEEKNGKEIPFEIISRIKARCEAIPTLFSIDIVDFGKVSSDFKEIAKSKIKIIQ